MPRAPRPHSPRVPDEKVIEALQKAGGIIAGAARMLGYTRHALWERIQKSPTLKAAHEESRETNLDIAETQLLKKVQSGDMTGIIFFLKCQGKKRGYIEKADLTINVETKKPLIIQGPDGTL